MAWMAERAAGALVDEGAKATARRIVARLRGDEAQAQFQAAWRQAVAALRREERFYKVADPLLQNSSLILEEAPKVATFGAEPDLDRVLRWSLGLPSEKRLLAREALEFLFDELQKALYDQPAYREIWAPEKISDVRAVEPLIRALSDPDEDVRWQAAWALGVIGEARALPELERVAQEDRSENVAEAARRAAERIRRRMGRSTEG